MTGGVPTDERTLRALAEALRDDASWESIAAGAEHPGDAEEAWSAIADEVDATGAHLRSRDAALARALTDDDAWAEFETTDAHTGWEDVAVRVAALRAAEVVPLVANRSGASNVRVFPDTRAASARREPGPPGRVVQLLRVAVPLLAIAASTLLWFKPWQAPEEPFEGFPGVRGDVPPELEALRLDVERQLGAALGPRIPAGATCLIEVRVEGGHVVEARWVEPCVGADADAALIADALDVQLSPKEGRKEWIGWMRARVSR